ncbi:MAG: hypothetical protein KC609_25820 [Myxococcales bacterium]|nr:hypothetical protein [Myxococcales bacterium]
MLLLLAGCAGDKSERITASDPNSVVRPPDETPTTDLSSVDIPNLSNVVTLLPIPEPAPNPDVATGALDDEGTFTMTTVDSNDPLYPVGATGSGYAHIEAYKVGHGVYRGQIVFEDLLPTWMYRNALEIRTTDSSIELEMIAIPVTYVSSAHPCGDRWEEVYTTTTTGAGDWETLIVEMKIKREVRHVSVSGCGAPDEATYRHRVRFVIH